MKRSTKTISRPRPTSLAEEPPRAYGIQDWQRLASDTAPPERTPEIRNFFGGLWPAAETYASPLNPIFLLDLPDRTTGSAKESWLIRDGVLPLVWFFVKNPTPGGFRGVLKIHAELERLIPDAWRPQVMLYELFPDELPRPRQATPNEVREILLTGLIMPSACSISRLEEDLQQIVQFIGGREKIPSVKIRAFLPARFEVTDRASGPSFYNYFMKTLFQYLGLEIEFLEYESLRWLYASSSIWMHEFNEKFLYADSYLSLLCLSKGHRAIPLNGGKRPRKPRYERVYPAYANVSCGIRSEFKEPFLDYLSGKWVPESQERAKAFFQATNSAANRIYPWPRWFPSWCEGLSAGKP